MKRLLLFSVICFLSGVMLIGCQRDRGVQAGNDDYQPRPAPSEVPQSGTHNDTQSLNNNQNQEIRGELTRVDIAGKSMTVRLENGMEQTFKWNDQSVLQGAELRNNTQRPTATGNQMADLKGKEGSEVTVMWLDDNGAKVATSVNITQLVTKNSSKNKGGSKQPTR